MLGSYDGEVVVARAHRTFRYEVICRFHKGAALFMIIFSSSAAISPTYEYFSNPEPRLVSFQFFKMARIPLRTGEKPVII